jgi:hypothetical protein
LRGTTSARELADSEIDLTPRPVRVLQRDRDRPYAGEWFFTLDPAATETLEERRARYMADQRLIHMGGLAVLTARAPATITKLVQRGDHLRGQLREQSPIDERRYDRLVAERNAAGDPGRVDQIAAELRELDEARGRSPNISLLNVIRENLLKALPEAPDGSSREPMWPVSTAFHACRQLRMLNGWYEPVSRNPPGRQPGLRRVL